MLIVDSNVWFDAADTDAAHHQACARLLQERHDDLATPARALCSTLSRVAVEIRLSALKHGVSTESIIHAVTHPLYIDEDFRGTDPAQVLMLGPDAAGNMLEVVGRLDADEALVVFHAMAARPSLLRLMNKKGET